MEHCRLEQKVKLYFFGCWYLCILYYKQFYFNNLQPVDAVSCQCYWWSGDHRDVNQFVPNQSKVLSPIWFPYIFLIMSLAHADCAHCLMTKVVKFTRPELKTTTVYGAVRPAFVPFNISSPWVFGNWMILQSNILAAWPLYPTVTTSALLLFISTGNLSVNKYSRSSSCMLYWKFLNILFLENIS